MTLIPFKDFGRVLERAWCRETSSNPDRWNPDEPCKWQCDVTAMAVKAYFDAKLLREKGRFVDGVWRPHYFNELNGKRVDLAPFYSPEIVQTGASRELDSEHIKFMFANLNFARRYRILRENIAQVERIIYSF